MASVARRKVVYQERKAWLDGLKSHPCVDCGGMFPAVCMDFHHARGVKTFRIADKLRSKEAILAELEKCDLLCSNCHRIRHAKARG